MDPQASKFAQYPRQPLHKFVVNTVVEIFYPTGIPKNSFAFFEPLC